MVQTFPDLVTPSYDPFRGATPRGASKAVQLPAGRLLGAGFTEDEVEQIRAAVGAASLADRNDAATFLTQTDDDGVRELGRAILDATYTTKNQKIELVMTHVQDHPGSAEAALAAEEQAAKPRKTLLDDLRAFITARDAAATEAEEQERAVAADRAKADMAAAAEQAHAQGEQTPDPAELDVTGEQPVPVPDAPVETSDGEAPGVVIGPGTGVPAVEA